MGKSDRLREKYSRASKQCTIPVEKDDTTGNATKSELGLRPVQHYTIDRVVEHLFIKVLEYHLVHTIRYNIIGAENPQRLVEYPQNPVEYVSRDRLHFLQKQ